MHTPTILSIYSAREKALAALNAGMCVSIPTETVYGLAADATNGEAVASIFEMKGRPSFNPLIAHVCDQQMAMQHGILNARARRLADTFWPGPLTLVVAKSPSSTIHDLCSAGLETIGLRCPQSIAREIIEDFGKPLAAPSANRSGRVSPTTAEHVAEDFGNTDLLILDGGPCSVGIESTIVKVTDETFSILRPGSITADMIETVTGAKLQEAPEGIHAPGMMASHYAPRAKVLLEWGEVPENSGLLAFGKETVTDGFEACLNLSEEGSLLEAAANLYAHLKTLDRANVASICVSPIPNTDLGIAINDRLRRAAAPNKAAA